MHRLTGVDAMFLYLETQLTPMHVASLSVCEPPEGYVDNPYEAFRAQVASRLHEVPSFIRKLTDTPLALDHPIWINAEKVDLEYHIRRAALPKPGSWQQLMTMVEHLHTQVLDRTKPLWQFHVIEGLEDGRFALYMKSHHASIDGGGGILALDIISDREPTPRPPLPSPEVRIMTREPGFFEHLGLALGNVVQQQVNVLAKIPDLLRTIGRVAEGATRDGRWGLGDLKPAPHTIFNARVGRRRAFATASVPLKDLKAVAKAGGATLNDVVLAVCGGALRAYLAKRGALPEDSLVAAVPVSLREVGDMNMSNQVSSVPARIGTHIAEPLERLAYVQGAMQRSKKQLGDVRAITPTDFSFIGAPALVPLAWQVVERTSLIERMPALFNVAISNVPGPRRTMYFAGIPVREFYPVSIATHGVALNITVQSYVDRLDFGFTTCREICPDVADMAAQIAPEFAALKAAVADAAAPAQPAEARKLAVAAE